MYCIGTWHADAAEWPSMPMPHGGTFWRVLIVHAFFQLDFSSKADLPSGRRTWPCRRATTVDTTWTWSGWCYLAPHQWLLSVGAVHEPLHAVQCAHGSIQVCWPLAHAAISDAVPTVGYMAASVAVLGEMCLQSSWISTGHRDHQWPLHTSALCSYCSFLTFGSGATAICICFLHPALCFLFWL